MPDDASNARPDLDAPIAPLVPTVVDGTQAVADASLPTAEPNSSNSRLSKGHGGGIALAIGAVGVVFGDIGTSPLYAFQETIAHHGSADRAFVMGVLSLIFWALFLVVVAKYQLLIMRATNRGEGGSGRWCWRRLRPR